MSFRNDFIWGTAMSSYQIEGTNFDEGQGLSVWDIFSRKTGAISGGDVANMACDHYHRYKEDIKLMKEVGVKAYRLSISWPRILPEGTGKVNEKGIEFYNKVIDELLESGITPFITLFHWEFPYELYKRGGWLNVESSNWFAEFTKVVVESFSDRVTNWMTLNEPQCFVSLGHENAEHAPGLILDRSQVLLAAHNALLAHGKAVQVIRKYSKQPCNIGYAPVGDVKFPDTNSAGDIDAARKAMFSCPDDRLWGNTWWMDPVFFGRYPEDGLKLYEKWLPQIKAEDMKIISEPVDFFGCNIYQGERVKKGIFSEFEVAGKRPGYQHTDMDWPVTPEALYWGPKFFYERYKKPIIITENGMANLDFVSCIDNKVHDPQRIDFLYRYIRELKKAVSEDVDVRGYFLWSFMDNFEWAFGFNKRFGIVHVDFDTQKRTMKDSAYWYSDVIKTNGEIIR